MVKTQTLNISKMGGGGGEVLKFVWPQLKKSHRDCDSGIMV